MKRWGEGVSRALGQFARKALRRSGPDLRAQRSGRLKRPGRSISRQTDPAPSDGRAYAATVRLADGFLTSPGRTAGPPPPADPAGVRDEPADTLTGRP